MYYSAIVLLALFVLVIENYDIIFKPGNYNNQPAWATYRKFLLVVLVYYTADTLWGIIEHFKLPVLLYIDTAFYFISMGGCILLWTQFQVTYLNDKSIYNRHLLYAGRGFFGALTAAVIINLITPILFSVDAQCVYHAYPVRHVFLIAQIVLLVLTSGYLLHANQQKKKQAKRRSRTIALCGLLAAAFLTVQLWFPYLPLYTVAYMLGTCLLHSFVVNDEKDEYKTELENALAREKKHFEELDNARTLAYQDALTGVKSKVAYLEFEDNKNRAIREGLKPAFAVAVFDINGLKEVNDTLGHEKGDELIISACSVICRHFKHSPIFRIGGDEFVALLEGEDYQNRTALISSFNAKMDTPESPDQVIIAMGVSEYRDGEDDSLNTVFVRADTRMYERKHELKSKKPASEAAYQT